MCAWLEEALPPFIPRYLSVRPLVQSVWIRHRSSPFPSGSLFPENILSDGAEISSILIPSAILLKNTIARGIILVTSVFVDEKYLPDFRSETSLYMAAGLSNADAKYHCPGTADMNMSESE